MASSIFKAVPLMALTSSVADATWAIVAIDKRTGSVGCTVATCVSGRENLQRVCEGIPGVGVVGSAAFVYEEGRTFGANLVEGGLNTSDEVITDIRDFDREENSAFLAETRQFAVCQNSNEAATEPQCSVWTGGTVEQFCSTGSFADSAAEWNCTAEAQVFEQGDFIVVAMANYIVRDTVQLSIDGFFTQDPETVTLADRLTNALVAGAGTDNGDVRCRSTNSTQSSSSSSLWVRHTTDDPQDCANYTLTFEDTGNEDAVVRLESAYENIKCIRGEETLCNQTCVGREAGTHEISGVQVYCDGAGRALIQSSRVGDCTYAQASQLSPENCGYLSKAVVETLARNSEGVHLEQVEGGVLNRLESVGSDAVHALRLGQSWHNSDRTPFVWNQTAGNQEWCFDVDPCEAEGAVFQAESWPDMYHSCRRSECVHWLAGTGHSMTSSFPSERSRTWLVMNEPTETCQCAEKNVYDTDEDCFLNATEVDAWLTVLAAGQVPAQAQPTAAEIIAQLDTDGDDKLNRAEYSTSEAVRAFDPTVVETFALMDTNRDGLVSPAEAAVVFGTTAEEVTEKWGTSSAVDMVTFAPLERPVNANTFDWADKDSAGLVKADELQALFNTSPAQAESILSSSPRGTTLDAANERGLTFAQFDVLPSNVTINRYLAADTDANGEVTTTEVNTYINANGFAGTGSSVVSQFDNNGNNVLSLGEFANWSPQIETPEPTIQPVQTQLPLNSDDVFERLVVLNGDQTPEISQNAASVLFNALDLDQDGSLTRPGESDFLFDVSPTKVQGFALADANRDGSVSPAEYAQRFDVTIEEANAEFVSRDITGGANLEHYSEFEFTSAEAKFDTGDEDGSGRQTFAEFRGSNTCSSETTDAQLQGFIDFATQQQGVQSMSLADYEKLPACDVRDGYILQDGDGSGELNRAELMAFLEEKGLEPADADRGTTADTILSSYDANRDGELDFTEFIGSDLTNPGPYNVEISTPEPTGEDNQELAVIGAARSLSPGAIAGLSLGLLALLLLLLLCCCLLWWCCCRKKPDDHEWSMYRTTKDEVILKTEPIAETKMRKSAVDCAPVIETRAIEENTEISSNDTQAKSLDVMTIPSPAAKKLKKFSVTKLTNYKTEYRTEATAESAAQSHARTFSQSSFGQSAPVDPYLSSQALLQNTHQVTDNTHDAWQSSRQVNVGTVDTSPLEQEEMKQRTAIMADYITAHTSMGTQEFKDRIATTTAAAKSRSVAVDDGYASQEETANAEYMTYVDSARNKMGGSATSGTPPVMQQRSHVAEISHARNVPMPEPVMSLPVEDIVVPVAATTTTTTQMYHTSKTVNTVETDNTMTMMHEQGGQTRSLFTANPQPISIDDGLMKQMMPTDRSASSKKLRTAVYKQMDSRGRGFLTLDDTQRGMRHVIGLHETVQSVDGEEHIENVVYGAAVPYAFSEAACIGNDGGDDKVDREEFRVLALYTRQYLQGYAIFDKAGVAGNKHFNEGEFRDASVALQGLGLDMGQSDELFHELHRAGGNSSSNGQPTVTQQRFMQHVIRRNEQLLSTDLDELVIGNGPNRTETKKSVESFGSDRMAVQQGGGFTPICLEDYSKKTGIPLQQIIAANAPYGPQDPVVMERPVKLPPLKSLLNRPTTVNDYSRKSGIPIDQLLVANPHFTDAQDVVDEQPVYMPWLEQTAMAQSF